MRALCPLLALAACHSSSPGSPPPASGQPAAAATATGAPALAIVGYGVELVPAPGISAAQLPNGVVIFGPRADKALPAGTLRNVAVKPGKPPTGPLTAHPQTRIVILSDGAPDTTAVALGDGMTSYDGVLTSVKLSPESGAWQVVVDGAKRPWAAGERINAADEGR